MSNFLEKGHHSLTERSLTWKTISRYIQGICSKTSMSAFFWRLRRLPHVRWSERLLPGFAGTILAESYEEEEMFVGIDTTKRRRDRRWGSEKGRSAPLAIDATPDTAARLAQTCGRATTRLNLLGLPPNSFGRPSLNCVRRRCESRLAPNRDHSAQNSPFLTDGICHDIRSAIATFDIAFGPLSSKSLTQ